MLVCSNLEKYAKTLNKQSKQEPFLPQAGTALRELPAISAERALPAISAKRALP
jgi:hypothetical protein